MAIRVQSIEDIINLIVLNPDLSRYLKEDPNRIAEMLGVSLSEEESKAISANLDIDEILKFAQEVDSFAAKVQAGIGIRQRGSQL